MGAGDVDPGCPLAAAFSRALKFSTTHRCSKIAPQVWLTHLAHLSTTAGYLGRWNEDFVAQRLSNLDSFTHAVVVGDDLPEDQSARKD